MTTISLRIAGMMCGGCVRRVRSLLEQAGAAKVEHVEIGSAVVTLNDAERPTALVSAVEEAGYTVQVEQTSGNEA
jgi:copper chaperone